MFHPKLACFLLALFAASAARADVALATIFGDHMVLQQGRPVLIWGAADPGETVTVTIGESSAKTTADDDGAWRVQLPAMEATAQPIEVVVKGNNTLTLTDVLVGEVWLCSGQSNMAWPVSKSRDAQQEIAAANYPLIRLFGVGQHVAAEPQTQMKGEWQACSDQTVGEFSAVGYFFGRKLHQELDVPVGLIRSTWGGTPAEAWMPRDVIAAEPALANVFDREAQTRAKYPEKLAAYPQRLERWQAAVEAAKAAGKPEPRKPREPVPPDESPSLPAVLYNGMIHPLGALSMRGVVWYQGEANADRPPEYAILLPKLIESWRQRFENDELAFGIVQLANYRKAQSDPIENGGWAGLRDVQFQVAQSVPHAGLAVAIDIGEAADIHPTNKQDVGARLAAWALHDIYGKSDVVPSGPVFKAAEPTGDGKLRITFEHTDGGLVVKGDKLTGFVVGGADGTAAFADAVIDGDTVVVSSPKVPQPVFARYGWANNPTCNLYNAADLPAVPFRSDEPPAVTDDQDPPSPVSEGSSSGDGAVGSPSIGCGWQLLIGCSAHSAIIARSNTI